MNIRSYLEVLDIKEGQSVRTKCPSCGSDNVFTATKELGVVKYNCYKLACSVGGYYHDNLTAEDIQKLLFGREEPVHQEPDTMTIPQYVVQPSSEHTKYHTFMERWGLTGLSLLYDVKDERVVFPIHYKGRIIDANGRAVGGKLPKWYRYTGAASYYIRGKQEGGTLVVVEDCTSAVIAAQSVPGLSAMAILGTSLSEKHYDKIAEYDKIVVALDPDAADKTLQFKREIEAWTGLPTKALRLYDDIKYRVEEDITNLRHML